MHQQHPVYIIIIITIIIIIIIKSISKAPKEQINHKVPKSNYPYSLNRHAFNCCIYMKVLQTDEIKCQLTLL